MKDEEKKKTAYHEAGHAMIAYHLDLDPVQQISIIPAGRALGYTLNPPTEYKYSEYKSELIKEISMLLGGRAAEEIVYNDVTGGASNDIERATKIAKKMVMRLGMSDVLGPRAYGNDQSEVFLGRDFSASQDYSDEIAATIDNEINIVIKNAYEKAKDILRNDIERLHFIAEFLLKNEVMDGSQFKAVMESLEVTMEDIEAIAEAKKQKSAEDNRNREKEIANSNPAPEAPANEETFTPPVENAPESQINAEADNTAEDQSSDKENN
jgi:cell division protease FtsH